MTIQNITIIPGEDFGPLDIVLNEDITNLNGYSFSARIFNSSASVPVSAMHDFDVATIYMRGAMINNTPTVVEYENFEGD